MEGIEHGYDDESRSPVQRKSLDQDGMSSDDDKRARWLEKQARKEEKKAKKEAKALRRASEVTASVSSENKRQRQAAEHGDKLVGGQVESGTWGNPIRLGDAAPAGPTQAENDAKTSAKAKPKMKRRADDDLPGRDVEIGQSARIDKTSAAGGTGEQHDVARAANPPDTADTANRPAHERKGKRKRGDSKGEGKGKGDGDGDEGARDKARKRNATRASPAPKNAGEGLKGAKEKAPTKKDAAVIQTASSSTPAEPTPSKSVSVKAANKRKRAAQPESEPAQQDNLPEPRSASSTPVPTPRPSATSPKDPVETTTSNADGFRAKSRKSASTSSAAGSFTPKRSKETDDELRRKLRTTDAVNAWLAEQWRPLPELARLEGLGIITYVRGKFSLDEKAAIKSHLDLFGRVNDLSQSDLVNVIMAKGRFKTGYDKFWVETAAACPGRPIQAVKKYVQREYDPRGNQGPWSKEEDADLKRAYATHPNEWTKIAMTVGRTEQDCRDRYKNDLETRDTRATGPWTKDEEAKLIEIVRNVNTTVGNDPLGHEAPWDIVEERMGGTRSRMQCRKKWQGQLRFSEMNNGQRAIFSKSERPFLVIYISRQHVESEAAIDWVKLARGIFSGLPTEALRNAYTAMKRSLNSPHDTSFKDTLRAMEEKWPIDSISGSTPKLRTSTKELGRRMARSILGNVASAPVISDESDVDDGEDGYEHLDPVLRPTKNPTKKPTKDRKKDGQPQESRKKELATNGRATTSASARVSESDSGGEQDSAGGHARGTAAGGDDDEANESEVDDVV